MPVKEKDEEEEEEEEEEKKWLHKQKETKLKVCKSVHHRTIQINHQPVAKVFQFIILTII
jgi:hypothetical protein